MKNLLDLINEKKDEFSSEELDEVIITNLYEYVNKIPNDYTLGFKFRKDIL